MSRTGGVRSLALMGALAACQPGPVSVDAPKGSEDWLAPPGLEEGATIVSTKPGRPRLGPAIPRPEVDPPEPEGYHVLVPDVRVVIDGCDDVTLHDNGRLIYAVAGRDCEVEADAVVVIVDVETDLELDSHPIVTGSVEVSFGVDWHRRVEVVKAGQWRNFPNEGTWLPRDGAGLLALNGALYLLGGWRYGPLSSEVWRTNDLWTWEYLGDAPWPPRHGAGWVVHDDRLWVIGGDFNDDVWSSSDGIDWFLEADQAPFGRRYSPVAASVNGHLLVFAGVEWNEDASVSRGFPDVWRSENGATWELATAMVPWAPRGLIHGSAVLGDEAFLIGGGHKVVAPGERYADTSIEYADIWSTRDGTTWTLRSEQFSFAPRTHFTVVSTPLGCYVSDGSVLYQPNVVNDLYFAPDCVDYEPIVDPIPAEPRHASSVAWWNGSLVILGGPPAGGAGTRVWQYFP